MLEIRTAWWEAHDWSKISIPSLDFRGSILLAHSRAERWKEKYREREIHRERERERENETFLLQQTKYRNNTRMHVCIPFM